ncbi:hypothetical protein CVT24_005410 [Panaeolus cyanescens]|uniref:Uncharacterized protein n=1 Tax=Panaeolus cyanescens TaxID=181874 RepID=A0A409Y988_9AGAR|nr:hypothetical protein CVT24_005410 [Panaeolus cyanescens]
MSNQITIVWADAAKEDIKGKTAKDFGGVDPTTFHEQKVQQYWTANHAKPEIKEATKARIRRGAHPGGSDVNEPDHITVSFRKGAKELKTEHVYTNR